MFTDHDIHKVPKVENVTPNLDEGVGQNRDSVAEATRKKMVSKTASKRAGSGTTLGIFERHRSG